MVSSQNRTTNGLTGARKRVITPETYLACGEGYAAAKTVAKNLRDRTYPSNAYNPIILTIRPAPHNRDSGLCLANHERAGRQWACGLGLLLLCGPTNMKPVVAIRWLLHLLVMSRSQLMLENLALRQQLAVLSRQRPRPPLQRGDRVFWVCLSKLWSGWRSALILVQPDTVVSWHQQGFRLYWGWKSRRKRVGRPPLDKDIRDLIRQMARDNPTWGAPRIQAELHLLGHNVAEATVAKYMARSRPDKPPSQRWKTFLRNHTGALASMDFFVVPTVTFRLLYVLVILSHDRRRVVHVNVTSAPSAKWVVQQLRESFPFETAPR